MVHLNIKTNQFLLIILLSIFFQDIVAQTNLKSSFYLGASPMISFNKLITPDPNSLVKIGPLPAICVELGYFMPVKEKFALEAGLALKKYKFRAYSKPLFFSTRNNSNSLTVFAGFSYLLKIKERITWKNTCTISSTYQSSVEFYSTSNDTVAKIHIKTTTTWYEGIKPFIGFGSGFLFRLKRTWYLGLTYNYGLNSFYTMQTDYDNNGTVGSTKVSSHLSHLQLDLRFHFKRNNPAKKREPETLK